MENINRLKVVLVEQGKTGKWLANQLGKSTCTVKTAYSLIWSLLIKLQDS